MGYVIKIVYKVMVFNLNMFRCICDFQVIKYFYYCCNMYYY